MRVLRHSGSSSVIAFFVLTLAACQADRLLQPDAANAGGVWESVITEPGTERWILDVQNGVVRGTGSWTGASCCGGGGTLTITGSAGGDSLHLDLTYFVNFSGDSLYVFRSGDHIDAILDSRTDLVGRRLMAVGSHGRFPALTDVLFSDVHFEKAPQYQRGD